MGEGSCVSEKRDHCGNGRPKFGVVHILPEASSRGVHHPEETCTSISDFAFMHGWFADRVLFWRLFCNITRVCYITGMSHPYPTAAFPKSFTVSHGDMQMQDRFRMDVSDDVARTHIFALIEQSITNMLAPMGDTAHRIATNFRA